MKQKTHGTSLEDVTEEGLERMRPRWQDRGSFKVQVTAEAKAMTSSPVSQRIAMTVHVDEGQRYNLKRITFKNNKAISAKEPLLLCLHLAHMNRLRLRIQRPGDLYALARQLLRAGLIVQAVDFFLRRQHERSSQVPDAILGARS